MAAPAKVMEDPAARDLGPPASPAASQAVAQTLSKSPHGGDLARVLAVTFAAVEHERGQQDGAPRPHHDDGEPPEHQLLAQPKPHRREM